MCKCLGLGVIWVYLEQRTFLYIGVEVLRWIAMSSKIQIAVVAVLAVMMMAAPAMAAPTDTPTDDTSTDTQTETDAETNETDSGNNGMSLGQRISGMVAMEKENIKGEIDQAGFKARLAQADSDEERAEIIAEQLDETNKSVSELKEEREEIREQYKNGNISESEYTTKMATLSAKIDNAEEMTNESEDATEGIPNETLEANGVNASAIQQLKNNAQNMSGQEVAEVARSIAGKNAEVEVEREDGEVEVEAEGENGEVEVEKERGDNGKQNAEVEVESENESTETETETESREEIEEEIAELENERQELEADYESGEVSEEEYNEELAEINAELDELNKKLDELESSDSTTDSGTDDGSQMTDTDE